MYSYIKLGSLLYEKSELFSDDAVIGRMFKKFRIRLDNSRLMFKTAGVYDKDAYIFTLSDVGLKVNNALDTVLPIAL